MNTNMELNHCYYCDKKQSTIGDGGYWIWCGPFGERNWVCHHCQSNKHMKSDQVVACKWCNCHDVRLYQDYIKIIHMIVHDVIL